MPNKPLMDSVEVGYSTSSTELVCPKWPNLDELLANTHGYLF